MKSSAIYFCFAAACQLVQAQEDYSSHDSELASFGSINRLRGIKSVNGSHISNVCEERNLYSASPLGVLFCPLE